jgi:hypothetical protein
LQSAEQHQRGECACQPEQPLRPWAAGGRADQVNDFCQEIINGWCLSKFILPTVRFFVAESISQSGYFFQSFGLTLYERGLKCKKSQAGG